MTTLAKNTRSIARSGNLTIEANTNRSYFFIVMTSGTGTISFGEVNPGEVIGEIPLAQGFHYSPSVCPTGKIVVTTAGTFVTHMG